MVTQPVYHRSARRTLAFASHIVRVKVVPPPVDGPSYQHPRRVARMVGGLVGSCVWALCEVPIASSSLWGAICKPPITGQAAMPLLDKRP
ncbi:MAG TPA: hypothetical protein PLL20_07025 [Phycisphaerae bacterium]|nr:hypothetical protein [Phycisphaerae bacterium]HRR83463.1 hypothetical protein [Phycisphaerae bacterium]